MSETPRQQLKNTLREEISTRAEQYCESIDSPVEFGGSGPNYAKKIREGVQTLIAQIEGDLDILSDDMKPAELLQKICARTLHNIETCLIDIHNLPREITLEIRRQEKQIREYVFQTFRIRPWTDDETALATVANKRQRPKRHNKRIQPPRSKPSTTLKNDEVPAYQSYARNPFPVSHAAVFRLRGQ